MCAENADSTGKQFVVYRKGASHTSVDGKIILQSTSDYGVTWSGETILATPAAGHDYRDPGIVRTATGRLLVTFFDYDGTFSRGLLTMKSDNAAASWSSLSSLIIPYTGAAKGGSTASVLQHSSGALLWPVYGYNTGNVGIGCGLLRSTDNGDTWGALIAVTTNTDDYSEWCLYEKPDTTVVGYVRQDSINQPDPVAIFKTASSDAGLTWAAVASLGFNTRPGKPFALLSRVTRTLYLWYRGYSPDLSACVWRSSSDLATFGSQQTYSASIYEYAGGSAMAGDDVGFAISFDNGANRADIKFAAYHLS